LTKNSLRESSGWQNVKPPLLPLKWRIDEILELGTAEQVIECPASGGMPDNDDSLTIKGAGEIVQEALNAINDLVIAFSAWVWLVDAQDPLGLQSRCGHAVQRAVVALAQAAISVDRDTRATKGDLGGFDGPAEIRRVYRSNVVGSPTLT